MGQKKNKNIPAKTIKQALMERRQRLNNDPVKTTETCVFMRAKSDINTGSYHPNFFARKWFREKSNINEVLNHYIAKHNIPVESRDKYTNMVIKKVISDAENRNRYPYNLFKFNTLRDESIGKLLLMYPQIRCDDDLDDVEKYYAENELKHCSVSMNLSNDLYNNIQRYLENKRTKQLVDEKIVHCCRHEALDITLRKYYWDKKLTEIIPLEELTLEKMYEISNFRNFVKSQMERHTINPSEYDDFVQSLFNKFKLDPNSLLSDKEFFVVENCAIITNNLTEREERSICNNILKFYDMTNVMDMFFKLWHTLKPARIKEEKIEFHRLYKSMPNKKMPPFHNLQMKKPKVDSYRNENEVAEQCPLNNERPVQNENCNQVEVPEIIAEQEKIIEPVRSEKVLTPIENDNLRPSVSDISASKLSFRQRNLVEKNYPEATKDDQENVPNNPVESHTEKQLPSRYGVTPEVSSNIQNLLNMIHNEYKLTMTIMAYLEQKYPHNFADICIDIEQENVHKNFVAEMLEDDPKQLLEMVNSCDIRHKTEVTQIIRSFILDTENFVPLSSSTQSYGDSIQKNSSHTEESRAAGNEKNPFQNDEQKNDSDSLSIVEVTSAFQRTTKAATPKDVVPDTDMTIKQEKITESFIQNSSPVNSSDVQVVSLCEKIIVLDSDDERNPNDVILEEAEKQDDYLKMIEQDSITDPEILERLQQYQLKTYQFAMEDKERKRKAAETAKAKGSPKKKKVKSTRPNNLDFIDQDSSK